MNNLAASTDQFYKKSLKYPIYTRGYIPGSIVRQTKVTPLNEKWELVIVTEQTDISEPNIGTRSYSSTNTGTSTSDTPRYVQMCSEFRTIMDNIPNEDNLIEDESVYIQMLISWIKRFSKDSINLLKLYLNSPYVNPNDASTILESIGDIDSSSTIEKRRRLLESNIKSPSPKKRYGAILGLSNMDSKESVTLLKAQEKEETVQIIQNTLRAVIKSLSSN